MKKLIALLLTLCLVASTLSGCVPMGLAMGILGLMGVVDDPEKPVEINPLLTYTLTQEQLDTFYDTLEKVEAMAIEGADWEQVDALSDDLDDQFDAIADQYNIAYVLYCCDQSEQAYSQQYLDASDLVNQMQNDYLEMVRRVYKSDSPIKDKLFEDWTEEELRQLEKYTPEVAKLQKRNDEIVVAYRELSEDSFYEDMVPLYNEMVRNNNRIARIYGYSDYYHYAYEMEYSRDFGDESVQQMRTYCAQYLAPLCYAAETRFQEDFYLNEDTTELVANLYLNDYDQLEYDYVDGYLAQLPQQMQEGMQGMFRDNRLAFGTASDSYQGAFTTTVEGEPFCYFGPGYLGANTVIHEIGHYYGIQYGDLGQPLDLSETQSQGNEWLFLTYLEEVLPADDFRAYESLQLYSVISTYVICVMVDEFEQRVYTHEKAGSLTGEEMDSIMTEIAQSYGGLDYVEANCGDVLDYWRRVVLEAPVYYISYAVSGLAALDLYTLSQADENQGYAVYGKLIQGPEDAQFLEALEQAGLSGPFEENVYLWLWAHYHPS